MCKVVPPLRLVFCSGGLAGQVVELSSAHLHIGRSAENDVSLTEQDVTVSGRHATLEWQNGTWVLGDAGSRTGTFINGQRLGMGDRMPVRPGDWILFGADGAAALVMASSAPAPTTWIVLAPENDPAGYLALTEVADARVAVNDSGSLDYPAPSQSKGGYRFRLDRTPVSAVALGAADGASNLAVEVGDVLKLGPDQAGIRVLGIRGRPSAAPYGQTTLRRAIRKEIGRRSVLPYFLVGLVAITAVVVTMSLLGSADRRHQREQVRVERDRVRLEQELDLLHNEFDRKLSGQQEEFDATLKLQQAETQRQLEKLAVSDRDRFGELLKQYRKSVILLLVRVRFPDIHLSNGAVAETGGWGTGWVVRSDGLVVTNKHVVHPWKTEPVWEALLKKHPGTRIEIDIFAWPAGQRFLDSNNKPPNENTGYNTATLKNLTLLGTAPDEWEPVEIKVDGDTISSRKLAHTDADLAVLKLTGETFTPIPVKADPTTMKGLDSVMLLGFPLGKNVLDSGRADLSASLGNIRFVSGVVRHTASTFGGNSGGPLLSLDGEVIGVLTRGHGETLSEAIRSDVLLRFLEKYQ